MLKILNIINKSRHSFISFDFSVFAAQLQHEQLVFSLFEPHTRTVQTILRADFPVSAQVVTVDPKIALTVFAHIEKGVTDFSQIEGGMTQTIQLRFYCSFLPFEDTLVQRKFIYIPLVYPPSFLQINEIQHSLLVKSLLPSEIDMAHGLHYHPHLARRIQTLYFYVEALRVPADEGFNKSFVDEYTCIVSQGCFEEVFSVFWEKSLVKDYALVVHFQCWALEEGQISFFDCWFSEIAEQTSYFLCGDARNSNSLNRLRHSHQLLPFSIIPLKRLSKRMILFRSLSFLGNRRIIIIRGNMRHIGVKGIEAICASSCCEVGPSEAHIKTHGTIVFDQIFYMLTEVQRGLAGPSLITPIRKPSTIHFSSKYQTILAASRRQLQIQIFEHVAALTETNMRTLPVIVSPYLLRILVVKLAHNAQVLPHLDEVESMLWGISDITELVLDLEHYDWSAVDEEERLYDWRKG